MAYSFIRQTSEAGDRAHGLQGSGLSTAPQRLLVNGLPVDHSHEISSLIVFLTLKAPRKKCI